MNRPNPSEALRMQVACAEWWSTTAGLETTINLFGSLLAAERGLAGLTPELLAEMYRDREAYGADLLATARVLAADLHEAAPFYVDGQIVDALVPASASLPDEVPLGLSQFPAPIGFAYLASNTLRIPKWGRLGTGDDVVRALSWAPVRLPPELRIRPDGTPDPGRVRIGMHVWVDRRDWPHRRTTVYLDETPSWRTGSMPWGVREFGDPATIARDVDGPALSRVLLETVFRFLLTLGAFVHERLVDDVPIEPDRATRRIMANKGLPANLPPIRTIQLRQHERPEQPRGDRAVDWSCSWLVRSHWRNQYHPSTGEHRWRPIPAYVKGPRELPFKVSGPALRSVVR